MSFQITMLLRLMFEFKPKFLYIYEGIANSSGYENEIKFCIPSFSGASFHFLKNSPPPFDFNKNETSAKYFFTFNSITDNYAYVDFGEIRITNGQSGSKRYAFRYYNQGKMIGNTFYWYAKGECKGAYAGDPIEDYDENTIYVQ